MGKTADLLGVDLRSTEPPATACSIRREGVSLGKLITSLCRVLDNALKRSILILMDSTLTPRQITHDEKKAAEAAFSGRPFNPKWSDAARFVYDGITAAMGKDARSVEILDELEPVEPLA